jgi:hypothetical protein
MIKTAAKIRIPFTITTKINISPEGSKKDLIDKSIVVSTKGLKLPEGFTCDGAKDILLGATGVGTNQEVVEDKKTDNSPVEEVMVPMEDEPAQKVKVKEREKRTI